MNDRHYLLKVLGLSTTPRIATFALKLVSYPLMVRSLGANELGVVVYIGAVITIVESFVDFGVSSAAGKEIAVARETGSVSLRVVIQKWARLQAIIAVIGLVPLLYVTYLIASVSSKIEFSLMLLVILVFAAWITVALNFIRACLTSVLAFKSLAVLDVFESILRSTGWLAVAYYMPSALGLAFANIVTAICASVLGTIILWRVKEGFKVEDITSGDGLSNIHAALRTKNMIKESINFLWLRLVTRIFQSIPIMMFGRMFGSEVVGIVGALSKIVDMINFPFEVIGNALAVRAPGVLAKGIAAAKVLWDTVSRFIAVSLISAVTVYLGAELLAKFLLPNTQGAKSFVAILSITIISTALSSVVAPVSDYVGGVRYRNILITIFTLVQAPVIWLGGYVFGALGAVTAYVLVLVFMNCGYVVIALKMFFPTTHYRLRSEMWYFLALTSLVPLFVHFLRKILEVDHLFSIIPVNVAFIEIPFFWLSILSGLMMHQSAKAFFLTKSFFDFHD